MVISSKEWGCSAVSVVSEDVCIWLVLIGAGRVVVVVGLYQILGPLLMLGFWGLCWRYILHPWSATMQFSTEHQRLLLCTSSKILINFFFDFEWKNELEDLWLSIWALNFHFPFQLVLRIPKLPLVVRFDKDSAETLGVIEEASIPKSSRIFRVRV